jgi:hypothetical protein
LKKLLVSDPNFNWQIEGRTHCSVGYRSKQQKGLRGGKNAIEAPSMFAETRKFEVVFRETSARAIIHSNFISILI